MTELLLCHALSVCTGDERLYRLQEQANASVTLCIMAEVLSVPAVHVHLAWLDAGWSMPELCKAI